MATGYVGPGGQWVVVADTPADAGVLSASDVSALDNVLANSALPGNAESRALCCYFGLAEGSGASAIGNPNDTPLTLTGTLGWKPERGLNFNGVDRAYVASTASQGLLRSILNLDSLTSDEMILVYAVIKHPTALAGTSTLFFWGRTGGAAPEGWGIKLSNSLSPRFYHAAFGASGTAFKQLELTNLHQSDGTNSNTMTALAIAISRTPNGDIELTSGELFLAVPGTFNGVNRAAVVTPPAKPLGASRPARWVSDVSLTLGAAPGTSESNLNDFMPAGVSLAQIEFQRRPRDPALVREVLRDLSVSPYTRPLASALKA